MLIGRGLLCFFIAFMFKIKAHRCKDCGERLIGRSDKMYCDDRCRVRYYRSNNQLHLIKRGVDQILYRNRSLLIRMRENMKSITSTSEARAFWLRRRGFDFNFHTHVLTLHDGRMAIMCYEEGYLLDGNGVVPWSENHDRVKALIST
jgi:hypothetical protein